MNEKNTTVKFFLQINQGFCPSWMHFINPHDIFPFQCTVALRSTSGSLEHAIAMCHGPGTFLRKKAAIFAPDRDSQHFSRVHHELVARSRFQGDANVVEGLRCQALRVINEMRASQIIRRALCERPGPTRTSPRISFLDHWLRVGGGRSDPLGRNVEATLLAVCFYMMHRLGCKLVPLQCRWPMNNCVLHMGWNHGHQVCDIRALKSCEKTLAAGMWEDHCGPGPADDEPLEPEIAAPVHRRCLDVSCKTCRTCSTSWRATITSSITINSTTTNARYITSTT